MKQKILIQSDFDGTITTEDQSFLILDKYANGDWRQHLARYRKGEISVGRFNTMVFAMVGAGKEALLELIRAHVVVRPGFSELLAYCREHDYEFVITSHGLDFYIEAILEDAGVSGVPYYAARTDFTPGYMDVQYIGPEGRVMADGFKEEFTATFQRDGKKVVFLGDGLSDIYPARRADYTFACKQLLKLCREENLSHKPFGDLLDIRRGLEELAADGLLG